MNRSPIPRLQGSSSMLVALIAASTVIVIVLNGYGLTLGLTTVLPHLFYIPIILTAYFFPRRGIPFACAISALYCGMIVLIAPTTLMELLSAGGRSVVFILIGAVVSVLTLRMQESAMLFKGVAERSSDIILLTDREGRATYVSPSFGLILGTDPSKITGRLPTEFIHPDDIGRLNEAIAEQANGKLPLTVTARTRKTNGEYVLIEYLGTPVISSGSFAGLQIIGRDVTERQRVQDAYREAGRRLAEVIDFLPDPTMVVDRAGMVTAWNHAMEDLSGIPARDIVGKGRPADSGWIVGDTAPLLIDYVLHRDHEGMKTRYLHVHFEGDTVRTERDVTLADGTRVSFWISATPLVDQGGEITGAIETIRDVTHQKQTERSLRESNTYLDTVINTLADPLFIKDRSFRFVRLNDSLCRFTGHTREDLLGKTDFDFFRKEDAEIFRQKDDEVFRTGQGNENEEIISDSLGNIHTIVTKKTIYTNTAGEKFIVGIIRDITERKKTELALQQALTKLNMLSSITRHDILNQLMGLRSYLELIGIDEKDPALLGYLEKGIQASEAIQWQIEFTRYYEDIGSQAPRWQDAVELFLSASSQLPLEGITLDVQVSGLSVYADPLIGKVFYNLLENSLRHGGGVTRLSLSFKETTDGLDMIYRDDGMGIGPEDKKNLFRRGFGKHTGLGLFLSREILSITGISITENGEPGAGVRFVMLVPKGVFRFTGST